jgi:hypothetical protein
LINLFSIELEIIPVPDDMAERAPDTTPVLTKGPEDVEKRLSRSLSKQFHLLRNNESRILGEFDLVVVSIKLDAGRHRHNRKVIIHNLPNAH